METGRLVSSNLHVFALRVRVRRRVSNKTIRVANYSSLSNAEVLHHSGEVHLGYEKLIQQLFLMLVEKIVSPCSTGIL